MNRGPRKGRFRAAGGQAFGGPSVEDAGDVLLWGHRPEGIGKTVVPHFSPFAAMSRRKCMPSKQSLSTAS